MNNQVINRYQSKKLLKFGIPSRCASSTWYRVKLSNGEKYYWSNWSLHCGLLTGNEVIEAIPAFTVFDLLQILPEKIHNSVLYITKKDNLYICEYVILQDGEMYGRLQGFSFKGDLIECLYKLVCSYKMLDEL